MRPPARAIAGNLVWSPDGDVWAVWRVEPFAHANRALDEKLSIHARLRGLLMALPGEAMLLSVCERLATGGVLGQMAEGVNLETRRGWAEICAASGAWLDQVPLHRRRYFLAAALPSEARGWRRLLAEVMADVERRYGIDPPALDLDDLDLRERQARDLQRRLGQQVQLSPATAGELCWLYARAVRRGGDEPFLDDRWEPGRSAPTGEQRVLGHLTEAVLREGGSRDDPDRPHHRRYVRVDRGNTSAYQTVLAMADMPHHFVYPDGGGEWLHQVEQMGYPVDWCVRLKSIDNADAQSKVRRKQRDLVGQVEQYDAEVSGTPPQLMDALDAISEERSQLAANPAERELQVTVLFSLAAPTLSELEEAAGAVTAAFEPADYGLARPTGGQIPLLRSMLPGASAAMACRDYTQFMLARDLAAGAPFCGAEAGDPRGLLLGVSLDSGAQTPVLFDPAYGPQVNQSPSLAAVGRLGSGKSFFLKRLCMDTVARGGQVVTIDRSRRGEYVTFGEALPGSSQVVRLDAETDLSLDPMRSFAGDERVTVTLGFLSLLAGCSAHSEDGAALAEAVDRVAEQADSRILDVLAELERMGEDDTRPDPSARALARRLAHYRRSATGRLAFGDGPPVALDADFVVFWAPDLALPDRQLMASGDAMLLPEQVFAQALLYLVAAVGRQVVFRDPSRFSAALYDEAWALLASSHGQSLLTEGVRDGRKHNGAMWLASQHPNDLAGGELADLLGARFVFDQAARAVPAALDFLGVAGNEDAEMALEDGLGTGQCLFRDVRGRVSTLQVLPPALSRYDRAFNTTPRAMAEAVSEAVASPTDEQVDDDLALPTAPDRPAPDGQVTARGDRIAGALPAGDPPEEGGEARARRRNRLAAALSGDRSD